MHKYPLLLPLETHTITFLSPPSLNTKMSTLPHLFNLPEQICYVQCGFCTTILLVSVPCSSLSMVVTVRCGHCTSLLSVNMTKVSFVPFHLLASLGRDNEFEISLNQPKEVVLEEVEAGEKRPGSSTSMVVSSDNEEEDAVQVNRIVNKPPEKRQRAPSAYNRFIKEEIRRLKAQNPNIPHKEAFSTAAKNWAHFPPMHCKRDGDQSCSQEEGEASWSSDATEGNGFRERKAPRKFANGKRHPLE